MFKVFKKIFPLEMFEIDQSVVKINSTSIILIKSTIVEKKD